MAHVSEESKGVSLGVPGFVFKAHGLGLSVPKFSSSHYLAHNNVGKVFNRLL